MATVSAAYDAVVLGVSQQPTTKRLSGQHHSQDNFISDAVRGLHRRPGARQLSYTPVAGEAEDLGTNFRNFAVLADDRYLTLLCRRPNKPGVSPAIHSFQSGEFGAVADGELVPTTISAAAAALLGNGVNAAAAVGDYIVFAHTYPVGSTVTDVYGTDANIRRAVVSVKQGTYSRTYTLRVKCATTLPVAVSYTVPSLYKTDGTVNSASAVAAQPAQIATQLAALLNGNAAFLAGFAVATVIGSSIKLTGLLPNIEYVEASDGGDNTQITATWRVVQDAADLPPTADIGHTVKIKPNDQAEVYYLRAEADSAEPTKVVWVEGTAAYVDIDSPFCIGYAAADGLYIGANPEDLQVLLDAATIDVTVPDIGSREVGDDDSMPTPHFVGREITELRVFQERLLVCSGPVVNASRVSSFFNFWRTTVLTYPDDDAVEMYATGSEADTLRSSVIFDRSVVFFGDHQQYAISGKVPLTGSTATIMQSSAFGDAATVRPVALNDLLFFVKEGKRYASVFEIAVGSVEDTSNSNEITRQLNDYVQGTGIEALGLSVPTSLLFRTTTRNVLYSYAFMNADGQRVFDSWSRWTFNDGCGWLAGLASYKDVPRPIFVQDLDGTPYLSMTEIDSTDTSNTLPHLDLYRDVAATDAVVAGRWCAFTGDAPDDCRWFGREDGDHVALAAEFGYDGDIVSGYAFDSVVRLTSPYVTDNEGRVTTGGELVVSSVNVDLESSGAMLGISELPWTEQPGVIWNGRILGQEQNSVGRRQLRSDTPSIFIGQVNENYILRLSSVDYRPLTITGVDWKGQYFKRTRSV